MTADNFSSQETDQRQTMADGNESRTCSNQYGPSGTSQYVPLVSKASFFTHMLFSHFKPNFKHCLKISTQIYGG